MVTYASTGWCHGEPITDAGKRRQLTKMIILIMAPVCILIGVALYFVSINIMSRTENVTVSAISLSKLINYTILPVHNIYTVWTCLANYLGCYNYSSNLCFCNYLILLCCSILKIKQKVNNYKLLQDFVLFLCLSINIHVNTRVPAIVLCTKTWDPLFGE